MHEPGDDCRGEKREQVVEGTKRLLNMNPNHIESKHVSQKVQDIPMEKSIGNQSVSRATSWDKTPLCEGFGLLKEKHQEIETE